MCEPGGVSETSGARALLAVAPVDYIAERTRLAKLAKANGDKAGAAFIQALKRPTVALWAVLAAADDADLVHDVLGATHDVAEVQASGHDSAGLAAASQVRRAAVDALADAAVASLARWSIDGAPRRQEARDIVDQLSRRPDLMATWLDGTLRDIPDAAVGFDAFSAVALAPQPERPTPTPVTVAAEKSSPPVDELADRRARADRDQVERDAETQRQRDRLDREQAEREHAEREHAERERVQREREAGEKAERAAQAEREALAKRERAAAEHRKDLAAERVRLAAHHLEEAQAAHQIAERLLATAQAEHATAEREHLNALARLEAL
jgi:hypothetical protein